MCVLLLDFESVLTRSVGEKDPRRSVGGGDKIYREEERREKRGCTRASREKKIERVCVCVCVRVYREKERE